MHMDDLQNMSPGELERLERSLHVQWLQQQLNPPVQLRARDDDPLVKCARELATAANRGEEEAEISYLVAKLQKQVQQVVGMYANAKPKPDLPEFLTQGRDAATEGAGHDPSPVWRFADVIDEESQKTAQAGDEAEATKTYLDDLAASMLQAEQMGVDAEGVMASLVENWHALRSGAGSAA